MQESTIERFFAIFEERKPGMAWDKTTKTIKFGLDLGETAIISMGKDVRLKVTRGEDGEFKVVREKLVPTWVAEDLK